MGIRCPRDAGDGEDLTSRERIGPHLPRPVALVDHIVPVLSGCPPSSVLRDDGRAENVGALNMLGPVLIEPAQCCIEPADGNIGTVSQGPQLLAILEDTSADCRIFKTKRGLVGVSDANEVGYVVHSPLSVILPPMSTVFLPLAPRVRMAVS